MSYLNIDPTLCRGKFSGRWEDYGEDWIVEEKYNGDRRVAQFTSEKTYFTGRRDGVNSANKRDVSSCLPVLGGPAESEFHGLILDGELTVPGGNHSDVTKVVGGSAVHAAQVLADPKHPGIVYRAFDILAEPGKDLTLYSWDYRRKRLAAWVSHLQDSRLTKWPKARIEISESYANPGHIVHGQSFGETLYKTILKKIGEGVVLKYRKSKYADQRFWVKVKPWDSKVVRCTGFKMGEPGKFEGLVGSLHFIDEATGIRGSCNGMTDGERLYMTLNQKDLIGRLFEVRYTTVLESGKLEHPRFHSWAPLF